MGKENDEVFDQALWRLEKYGPRTLKPLSPEAYRTRLATIIKKINSVISKAHKEFNAEYAAKYDIDACIIYGSWARGNPHNLSDLDLIVLCSCEPGGLYDDFLNRLKRSRLGIPIDDVYRYIIYTDQGRLKKELGDGLINSSGIIVVSPFSDVAETIRNSLTI